MIVISDSSSLILLTKSELLMPLTKKIKLTIPNQVYTEVVEEGLKKNFTDAIKIRELAGEGKILVKSVGKKREFPITLGKGEKEALELFYQEKADKIIVDDKKALNVCIHNSAYCIDGSISKKNNRQKSSPKIIRNAEQRRALFK